MKRHDLLIGYATGNRHPPFEGQGLLDCHLYRQPGRLVVHLVNLTNDGTWRGPLHELIRVGPLTVRMRRPAEVTGDGVQLLVADEPVLATVEGQWLTFELASALDHEVAVLG